MPLGTTETIVGRLNGAVIIQHEDGDFFWRRGIEERGTFSTQAEAEADILATDREQFEQDVAAGLYPDSPSLPEPWWEAR